MSQTSIHRISNSETYPIGCFAVFFLHCYLVLDKAVSICKYNKRIIGNANLYERRTSMSLPDKSIDPRLLASAESEFLKQGFLKAELKTICENAGITTGAVYKRYKGKEDLFSAIVEDIVNALNTFLTERSTIDLSVLKHGQMTENDKSQRGEEILSQLDLSAYCDTHPMALSGGQKQRTAIASGIASSKPVIIFDEPTSGLDLTHMKQVAGEILKLRDMGKTIFIVTHDLELILSCCDQARRWSGDRKLRTES